MADARFVYFDTDEVSVCFELGHLPAGLAVTKANFQDDIRQVRK